MHHRVPTLDLAAAAQDPAWPTRRWDLAAALEVIARHPREAGGALRLLEDWGEGDNDTLWVRLPAWLIELHELFEVRYGAAGAARLQRMRELEHLLVLFIAAVILAAAARRRTLSGIPGARRCAARVASRRALDHLPA